VHEHQPDHKTSMAMRVMEKHFMKSQEGKPFVQEYNRLEAEMANLRQRYNDLWEKAEPAFVDYMKKMGGMDA